MTQDVGLCGTASSPASAKRPPFRAMAPIPQPGCGKKEGEEGKREGCCSQFPGGICFLPQTLGALTSPQFSFLLPPLSFLICEGHSQNPIRDRVPLVTGTLPVPSQWSHPKGRGTQNVTQIAWALELEPGPSPNSII